MVTLRLQEVSLQNISSETSPVKPLRPTTKLLHHINKYDSLNVFKVYSKFLYSLSLPIFIAVQLPSSQSSCIVSLDIYLHYSMSNLIHSYVLSQQTWAIPVSRSDTRQGKLIGAIHWALKTQCWALLFSQPHCLITRQRLQSRFTPRYSLTMREHWVVNRGRRRIYVPWIFLTGNKYASDEGRFNI